MAKSPGKTVDILDQFEQQCAQQMGMGVAMLLWKNRHQNPGMSVQVDPIDIEELQKCVDYLGIKPKVVVLRPGGVPAQEAVPERPGHRAIAARPAIPPKNYVVIQLVDEKGDGFVPIESSEEGAQKRDLTMAREKLKVRAPALAQTILQEMQQGNFVDSTQREAAQMLNDMAKMLP